MRSLEGNDTALRTCVEYGKRVMKLVEEIKKGM
jgi:hypothetical protein